MIEAHELRLRKHMSLHRCFDTALIGGGKYA